MGLSSTPIRRRRSNELYQEMMEKRQLFLRSYQFSRKRSLTERIKRSLKRVFWFGLRLRSTHKISNFVWSRLRYLILYRRKRRFIHLLNSQNHTCFGCS
ncbi:hypothetical protein HS088_TW18G00485 [Tripterygium wilfordii]|uniref:Uncharacterized protein n=1 Tax=Tripterygium wilfordii TaxID=458696 RepID=A0A7J7CCJ5_TRIWF|nr:uncharacterized protein LOC119984527 [Tripterygium wilfordii]KAF5731800.1 hypothetical protein HS088_TW18G00485 [Tripterygium wilfordii]